MRHMGRSKEDAHVGTVEIVTDEDGRHHVVWEDPTARETVISRELLEQMVAQINEAKS